MAVDATQQANRTVARILAEAVGGEPAARRYYLDDERREHIHIARFADRPQPGVTTFATLGLSDVRIPRAVRPPLGVELIGACDSATTLYPPVLAALTARIRRDPARCEPGGSFPEVVPEGSSRTLRHAVLVPPFLWETGLGSQVVDYKTVAWLQVVPITDAELNLCTERGFPALEATFLQAQIDVFDPHRQSTV